MQQRIFAMSKVVYAVNSPLRIFLHRSDRKGVLMEETKKSWICLVCGYMHQGEQPPETCPICGAPETDFELHATEMRTPAPAAQQWRCLICGYVHEGGTPPETCPVCAASTDEFEPDSISSTNDKKQAGVSKQKIVIIGGGVAGISAAEHARKTAPDADIHVYSKEKELPYYRLNLTRYLAGEIEAKALPVHPQLWYEEQGIHLHRGVEVLAVNPETHSLELPEGKSERYDKLIHACGAHPFIPPIPGVDKEGVTAIRTCEDVDSLLDRIGKGVLCVCIGGGILGLEVAGALAKRGASVTLLEGFGYLLPRQLNREAAYVLEEHIVSLGITVRTKADTREIGGDDKVKSVILESGEALPADMVTITTGIRSNTHLARRAGLQVNSGVIVDSHLRASAPDIYAVGDAAEWGGFVYGLWEPARFQGAIAGQNAAGDSIVFGGMPRMNTLKVLGIDLFSIGIVSPGDGSYLDEAVQIDGVYRRFLFHDNVLVGAILVGDTKIATQVAHAIKAHTDMSVLLTKRPTANDIASYLSEQ